MTPHESFHTRDSTFDRLTEDERTYLLLLARDSLTAAVSGAQAPTGLRKSGGLGEKRSSFVTLRMQNDGALRGCRGECPARRPLVESVVRMAAASALDDPRFPPVESREVEKIRLEISALTPPRPVRAEEVEVGKHGLMIHCGWHAGLLLPQVAPSFGWDREQYLGGLCRKAGLDELAWQNSDAELYAFESESWGE